MDIKVSRPIDREKWLMYLGVKGQPDERLSGELDRAEKVLLQEARIKGIYRVLPREDVKTSGFSVAKHLEGCHKVAVMAVTLGIGVDNLIRNKQITDMAFAVILDCGASLLIESACDAFEKEIRESVGDFTTSRFSPGYGDYPLEHQEDVLRYTDASRKIGINATDNCLLVPRKSVTALIGIADHPVTGRLATCGECVLREKCTLRKEGKHCGD
ncbi:MAG: methionine synthase [Eubacterium sp.]|nr:methionine synthase [Candidatus Colimonas fimequi]